ncbi:MAG: hypothetical protein ACLGG0_06170 [Bacteriovoracia bacterium]
MKLFFFVGEISEATAEIKKLLESKGVLCMETDHPVEIVQTGQQQKFAVTFFSDPNYANFFLRAYNFPEMSLLHILYMPANMQISEEMTTKLEQLKVHIFNSNSKAELGQLLNSFIKDKHTESEFARHMQQMVDGILKRRA